MSSLVRTIQKRIAKRMGFVRQTSRLVIVGGVPQAVPFKRGQGPILNPNGEPIGQHWPQVKAPTNAHTPKRKKARGSRRGKHRVGFSVKGEIARFAISSEA